MTVKVKKKKMTFGDSEPSLPIEKLAETVSPSVWPPLFGDGKFENEAITFFHRIHCRECQRMEEQRRKDSESGGAGVSSSTGQAPATQSNISLPSLPPISPLMSVEEQSLQQTMDKNKESLKRKLLLRRSVTELVDQGIYPPLTAPAAYAEQRKQLERAKTGDLLRHKLMTRPDRQSLVQHHILEDTKIDPSLQDRQKLLKKAKLQDSLNDRLANRPGPLELVEGNILQTDPELKDAIIEGKLQFQKTSEMPEAALRRHFKEEPDDTSASEDAASPSHSDFLSDMASPTAVPTPPDITPFLQTLQYTGVLSPPSFSLSQISSVPSPTFVTSPPTFGLDSNRLTSAMSPPLFSSGSSTSSQGSSSGASRHFAKLKKTAKAAKTTPKRVIKFHEYKGPPSVVKNQPSPPPIPVTASGDTPYHILLQQQQLLLQWQLETQSSKKLPIFLSTAQKQVLTAAASSTSAADITQQMLQAQQIQVQQVGQSSAPSLQTMTQIAQPQIQRVTQVKAPQPTATIITPVGTPIPVTTPSPVSMPSVAPPPTIVASIPAAVPANAIPAYRPMPAMTSVSPVVTTLIKTVVTSPSHVTAESGAPHMITKYNNNNTGSKNTNNYNSINRSINKLDDLKVAELKSECKKRNIPISGPKPNLLEKLKNFADEIVAEFRNNSKNNEPIRSTSSVSSVSSLSSSHSENSLTSPPSISNFTGKFLNIEPLTPINDDSVDSMTIGSPPMSPDTSVPDLNAPSVSSQSSQPMSPDTVTDVLSPDTTLINQPVIKNQFNSSQTVMPMTIDPNSRPSSVVPMDVELGGGHFLVSSTDLNQNPKLANTQTLIKTTPQKSQVPLSSVSASVAPPPAPPLPPPRAPTLPQIITIRPPGGVTLPQGAAPAQIQLQGPLTNPAQIRAQLFQQITAHMVRFPGSQVVSPIQVGGQPSTLTIAQPRPMLTQVSNPAPLTKTVTVVPQHSLLATQPTQMITSVRPSAAPPVQVSMSGLSMGNMSLAQTSPQVTMSQVMPQISIAASQKPATLQPIGQPAVISNEELVKQQQKKIEDLTKQLIQYQVQLQQQSEQLKMNLAQAQIQGPEQAKAQQQAQQQAQALAQTHAHVQALAQVHVQLQTQSNALTTVRAPVHLQTQVQAPQQQPCRAKVLQTTSQPAQLPQQFQVQSPTQVLAQAPVQPQQVLVQQAQMLSPPRSAPAQTPSPRPSSAQLSTQPTVLTQVQVQQVQNPSQIASPGRVAVSPIQTVTTQPPINGYTPNSAILTKSDAKPLSLNSILQNPALHGLSPGQHKLLLPNGQQVYITSQPAPQSQGLIIQQASTIQTTPTSKSPKVSSVSLNGVSTSTNNKSSSVPSSPIGHAKLVRSATNPFFPNVPVSIMKEPPKYDEAMKNKQNVLLQQQPVGGSSNGMDVLITSPSTSAPTSMTISSALASIKSEYVDDVLDILIKNGELPASAAQEPPPTPRVTSEGQGRGSDKLTTSQSGSQVTQPYIPTSLASVLNMLGALPGNGDNSNLMFRNDFMTDPKLLSPLGLSTTVPSESSISAANTVLSIANGLKLSGQLAFSNGATVTSNSITSMTHPSHVVQSSPAFSASITSPLSNHGSPMGNHSSPLGNHGSPLGNQGSPLGSDSGVGSSVGRKDMSLPLSISPAISTSNSTDLPSVLAESTLADFQPLMDWSDTDIPDNLLNTPKHNTEETDMCVEPEDDKDFFKQIDFTNSNKTESNELNMDDFFKTSGMSSSCDTDYTGLFSPLGPSGGDSGSNNVDGSSQAVSCPGGHSTPNLQSLGFSDMDMMDAGNGMNIDVSDWLDVVMPPSGLTPTITLPPPNTFSADPILTPKSQEFLDLFNLVESDLYTPTDMGLTLEKAMEASTSKS